ncbi:MAG: 30S ribosomal protein S3 [Candidatus Pacebacteria bacterium]|nr:30S ribosomal protein S3 [Candidatus Paceibacterota bacterium]
MSHKVHPKSFKTREMKDWMSRGFYKKNFPAYLEQDFKIRQFLIKKIPQGIVQDIELERTSSALKIIIKTSRPALIIGRGGKGVEDLKAGIEKVLLQVQSRLKNPKNDIKIEIIEIKNPWLSASLTAQWVAGQIEKMVPFRRVLKMAISKTIEQKEIQGVKVEVSGRLNGVEISRREWLKEGRLPRQTIRAVVEYGFAKAHCTYGVIGVKVWLYKGEKFS